MNSLYRVDSSDLSSQSESSEEESQHNDNSWARLPYIPSSDSISETEDWATLSRRERNRAIPNLGELIAPVIESISEEEFLSILSDTETED